MQLVGLVYKIKKEKKKRILEETFYKMKTNKRSLALLTFLIKIGKHVTTFYGVRIIIMRYKIKELRKKNGDTLKGLAQKINYDFSNLSKIERGIYQPSLPLLERIAAIYNVGVDYFFEVDQFLREEQEFMSHLDLDSKALLEDYQLFLDGKKLSDSELDLVILIIRKLRAAINHDHR
jgi:transcriptional regulator with XRE-family HTH domain